MGLAGAASQGGLGQGFRGVAQAGGLINSLLLILLAQQALQVTTRPLRSTGQASPGARGAGPFGDFARSTTASHWTRASQARRLSLEAATRATHEHSHGQLANFLVGVGSLAGRDSALSSAGWRRPLSPSQESAEKPKSGKWVKWRTLILRTWAVDPELCPRCHKEMKRAVELGAQAPALIQHHELNRLLKNLAIGLYPTRPRSPPPPSLGQELEESQFSDCESQVPTDWDNWEAA
ncbi:MAG: hypothetical protein U0931_35720 [Vulcanimicrobiota bacterium]